MIVEYPYGRDYLFTALKSAPDVYAYLLEGMTVAESDYRPVEDRFTIREAIAHVTAWEEVYYSRIALTLNEDTPTLPLYYGHLVEPTFAALDPYEQLALFRERRATTIALLEPVTEEQWKRVAVRQGVGLMTVEAQAVLIPLHDTYHFGQIVEWRGSFKA